MPTPRLLLVVSLGLMLIGCKGAAPLPPKALELNRAGVEALETGDLETADARFALALEYNPRFVEALVNMGLVELQRGNFRRARQLLGRARRMNPDVAQPHHGLGVLAEREQRPDLAAKHYDEALRVDPGFAPARANLARLFFEAGNYEHARVQFKRLTEVAPEEPSGYVGLAETLLHLGRQAEAEAAVEVGVKRFPDSAALSILAARGMLRRGQIDAAVELLTPIARSRDDLAVSALGWLATAELARGRIRHAIGAAKRALALDPRDSVSVYVMAAALRKLDDPSAGAWAKRAEQLAPGSVAKVDDQQP
ncbi:MAG: tetratricopeptide repeat protein [Myxococcales bacterium]|nr:tetratricopeptide repeat protein [Myxococcales bacterium]